MIEIKDIEAQILMMMGSGCDALDSITSVCEKEGIEIETVIKLVKRNPIIMANLTIEAETLNLIPKETSRLPI